MRNVLMQFSSMLARCASLGSGRDRAEYRSAFQARHHAIYVDQFGNIKQPESKKPIRPNLLLTNPGNETNPQKQLSNQIGAEKRYVDAIIENYIRQNKEFRKTHPDKTDLKFTLFIHGGLNTFNNAWGRANLFSSAMLEEGQYPLFVGWNSGPFTNYFDHLFRVRKGERRPALAGMSMPFVLIEDVSRSISHIPVAWYMSVMDPVTVLKSVNSKSERDFQVRMERLKDLQVNVNSNHPFVGVGRSYATIFNPIKFVTAAFVDGLGAGSWDSMLRRTDLVLSRAKAFEGEISKETPNNFADTAVTMLLKKLEMLQIVQSDGSKDPVRVDLIGHSMGAIVANNILARHSSLSIDNVVFMGAAARIKDIENGVVPWLLGEKNNAKFYNLSLDPYREISENLYYDTLPRGSLLHWIDNIFGEVNSFKDRTAGGWWNIIRTAEDVFPETVRQRVYLTRFPIGGEEMGPQTHGEFDEFYFWRRSFWMAELKQRKFQPKR